MVGMCGPQPDDGAVFVIKPFALLVPTRQLQTLLTPEALDPLVANTPAFHAQQGCDFPITIPPHTAWPAGSSPSVVWYHLLVWLDSADLSGLHPEQRKHAAQKYPAFDAYE